MKNTKSKVPAIQAYSWATPNGHKVHIMLEECGFKLGKDWEANPVDIGKGDQFKPEFLNRIDEVIMFEPLTRDDVADIVKIQFNQIADRLAEQHMTITATDEAIEWLAELGYDPHYGARPVKRVLQKQVLNELSKQLLADKVDKSKEIVLDVFDKQFVFRNK